MSDRDVLGSDLIAEYTTATIFPGVPGDRPMEIRLVPRHRGTRFIGVMPLYRRMGTAGARTLILSIVRPARASFNFRDM
jgi:hypothetical protein